MMLQARSPVVASVRAEPVYEHLDFTKSLAEHADKKLALAMSAKRLARPR
jgi:hypothetical protein